MSTQAPPAHEAGLGRSGPTDHVPGEGSYLNVCAYAGLRPAPPVCAWRGTADAQGVPQRPGQGTRP